MCCSGKCPRTSVFLSLGEYFFALDRQSVLPGYPKLIKDVWGISGAIDAAFTRLNCQGKTYIFKVGRQEIVLIRSRVSHPCCHNHLTFKQTLHRGTSTGGLITACWMTTILETSAWALTGFQIMWMQRSLFRLLVTMGKRRSIFSKVQPDVTPYIQTS